MVHLPPRTSLLISCRSTQLVVIQARLLHQVLLGKLSTYRFDRTIVTAGAPRMLAMSTSPPSAGASSRASAAAASLCSNGNRSSAFLCSCGHHLFDGGGCGFCALLMRRGLALQLRYEFFNSGGWATTPSRLPHCIPLAFVAILDGLRRRHLLHTRKISHQ
jgi:hypothetical protein